MGWSGESWHVTVTLDAHGGDTEREHEALWEEMVQRLRAVRDDPRYADLNPM